MLSLALLVIGAVVGAYIAYADIPEFISVFLGAVIGFLVVFAFLVIPITAVVDVYAVKDYHEIQVKELVSLDRGTDISGRFILGSGEVEGKPSYFAYVKNNDGSFQLFSLLAEKTVIFERPVSGGILHIYEPTIPVVNAFSFFTFDEYRYHYVLEIPNGSIIQEFKP